MNAELKQKWLDALRSGRYSQGKEVLKKVSYVGHAQHCCLGVLCEVVPLVQEVRMANKALGFELSGSGEADNKYLTPSILAYVGLTDSQQKELAAMNDDEGLLFDEIAAWVEKNVSMS